MLIINPATGRPFAAALQQAKKGRPVFDEIADTGDGKDITRGYLLDDYPMPPQDEILNLKGDGSYDIYREVLRDDQVKTATEQRANAIISKEWEVQPGGNKRRDKAAAAWLEEMLNDLAVGGGDDQYATAQLSGGFDETTRKMWYGVFYGFSVAEVMPARDGSTVALDAIKVRDRRRFTFDGEFRLRLRTLTNPLGALLPARKFWAFATGADHDDEPYGMGLGHWLYWPVLFKKNGLSFWLQFLEKFGMPTAVGEYPAEIDRDTTPEGIARATDTKARLLAATRAIQSNSGIIMPQGMVLRLLEAARSGIADYSSLHDRMQAIIAKVIIGQTASSEGTAGKLGSESVREDVKTEYVKADADLICNSFNRTVARWFTDWNFPGAAYPRVWRVIEDQEDLNTRAERDFKLWQMGHGLTPEAVAEIYGDGYQAVSPPTTEADAPTAPPTEPGPAEFAEAEPPGAQLENWIERLSEQAGPAFDAMLEPLRELVMNARSFDEIQANLAGLYEEMPDGQFAAILAEAMTAAEFAGRYDVQEEVKD